MKSGWCCCACEVLMKIPTNTIQVTEQVAEIDEAFGNEVVDFAVGLPDAIDA